MLEADASGFWSYVHRDDNDNRLTRLAHDIREEYSALTGVDFELFMDRESLQWGDIWRGRLDNALLATSFFIPIVTPRYFKSTECRNELLTFAREAESVGLTRLLLPIYYISVPEMDDVGIAAADPAIALIARTQYEDWRSLRRVAPDSEAYSKV